MNLKILHELDRILKNNPSLQANKHAYCQVVNGVFDIELKQIDNTEIHALAEQIDRAVAVLKTILVKFGNRNKEIQVQWSCNHR